MDNKFDISVLLPVYNVAPYIEQSLRSLFTQTKTDGVEFIIVNDATPDNSIEIARNIAEEYPNLNIKFVDHSKNRGLCAARKSGIEVATGKYIVFIDSDDWCENNILEELFAHIEQQQADIVSCDMFYEYPDKTKYKKSPINKQAGIKCAKALVKGKIRGYLWNKIFCRSLFTQNNISFLENLNMWEDILISTQVYCYASKVVYLNKAYVHYRKKSKDSITNVKTKASIKNKRANEMRVVDELKKIAKEQGFNKELKSGLRSMKLNIKIKSLDTLLKNDKQNRHIGTAASI